ncbi:MAG: hypothetical protein Q9226_003297 [Calogaya cf. arnoldii]
MSQVPDVKIEVTPPQRKDYDDRGIMILSTKTFSFTIPLNFSCPNRQVLPPKNHMIHFFEIQHTHRIKSSIEGLSGLQSLVANRLGLVKLGRGKKTGDARDSGFIAELDNLGTKLGEWKEELNDITDRFRPRFDFAQMEGLEGRPGTLRFTTIYDP